MRLYLVQHGDTVPEDVDQARPLSEIGQSDVAAVARFLASGGLRVAEVLHSGKLRAEQTAASRPSPGAGPRARGARRARSQGSDGRPRPGRGGME